MVEKLLDLLLPQLREWLTPDQINGILFSAFIFVVAWPLTHFFKKRIIRRLLWTCTLLVLIAIWSAILLTTKIESTKEGHIGIWVARIKGDFSDTEQQGIIDRIQSALHEDGLSNRVEVRNLKRQISGEEKYGMAKAKKLGEKVNAKIVIWGNLATETGKTFFSPKIKILHSIGIKQTEPPQKVVVEREDVSLPPEYVKEIVLLCRFLTGFAFYEEKKYSQAISNFEELLQSAKSSYRTVETNDVNFFLANCHLFRIENLSGKEKQQAISTSLNLYTALIHAEKININQAAIQNNLGNVFRHLAETQGETQSVATLKRAISAYNKALEVYTRKDFSVNFALVQNNLGVVYRLTAGIQKGAERLNSLRQAITAYEKALEVRTQHNYPIDFATTQSNLGVAYNDLARYQKGDDRQKSLNHAIAAYDKALKVDTYKAFPLLFAGIQNNLGVAYQDLSEMQKGVDKERSLKFAIEAFDQALNIDTIRTFPMYHRKLTTNREKAIMMLKDKN